MRNLMTVIKALADENRVRILLAVQGRELCVCQIVELLGLAPSTVSKHMAILKGAGVVESRKRGRWVHYRLAGAGQPEAVRSAIRWAIAASASSGRAREDARKLKVILEVGPQAICAGRRRRRKQCQARSAARVRMQ